MTVGNAFRIPQYLVATSPKGLVAIMLKNNLKYACEFRYFDIQFVDGKWYAWFNAEISKDTIINETLKEKK